MDTWLYDLSAQIAELEAEGRGDEEMAVRGRAVLQLVPSPRYVGFEPECINGPRDYVEICAALAEVAGPALDMGPFEVTSSPEALTFRGRLCGADVELTRPPIDSDWFDVNALFELNEVIAARGIDLRFTPIEITDSYYVFVVNARTERALQRHPLRLIWVEEPPPDSEAPPSEAQDADEASSDDEELDSPAFQDAHFVAVRPASPESMRVVGLAKHPHADQFVVRLAAGDGATRAMIVREDGTAWFVPEGAVDMGWSPDGATTYVLSEHELAAWVWGASEVRARYGTLGARATRVIASACGAHVAVFVEEDGAREVRLLDAGTLEQDGPLLLGSDPPVAFGFSDDGRFAVCVTLLATPEENGASMMLGSFRYRDGETFGSYAWNVEPEELAGRAPPVPDGLERVRFEGTVAVVDLPGWGEVRLDLSE